MDIDDSGLLKLSLLLIINNIMLTFSIINALVVLVTTNILVWVFIYIATTLLEFFIVGFVTDVSGRFVLFIFLFFLIFGVFLAFGAYYFTSCSSNAFANSYITISLIIFQGWVTNLFYVTPFLIRIGKELDSNIIAISGLLYPLLVTSLLGSILFLLGVIILSEKKFP